MNRGCEFFEFLRPHSVEEEEAKAEEKEEEAKEEEKAAFFHRYPERVQPPRVG